MNQYDKLIEHRTIAENERVELIEGVLVNKMGRNRPHIVAGNKGLRMLSGIIPNGWYIAKEDPVVVSDWSKPEPDLAIVRGQAEDYIDHDVTASDLALVVEIAESSLSTDQQDMARSTRRVPFRCTGSLSSLTVASRSTPIQAQRVISLVSG